MAGLLTAYKMAQSGIDYILIEADRILSGVSVNTTAKITSQHGFIYNKLVKEFGTETAQLYYFANEAAISSYRFLCRNIQCDFEEKDSYVYSLKSQNELVQEMETLSSLGIHAEFSDSLPLPFPVSGAISFKNQAQFNPVKFAAEISKGLNIFENTRALSFEGNTVVTNKGKITASNIIMATHFPIINKHGFYFLKLFQERSYVVALKGAQDVDGMYIDGTKGGLSLRNYGDYLLLGAGAHRTGKRSENWEFLEKISRKYFPDKEEKYRWATQDCITLDGIPYIGQYSKSTPNLFVATGFNKWGMTSSMIAAEILCDTIKGSKNPYYEIFSPSRTIMRPQLLINGFEAFTNIVNFSRPRCPHLGCALKWNKAERSWDCPCHGSRFSEDGKLLENPATGNIKPPDSPEK